MNERKAPEIRFKGFTDDWEQRKVSEIGNIVTGSTPKTSISDNYGGEFLFVSPAHIQENRYVDETITTLTKKGFDQGRKIREGASLFVSIGSTIGKVAQTSQESTTNQQINAVEPYDNFDDDFIFTSLENISGSIKAIASNQAVPIVNKTTFGETEIKVPSELAAQQKIGAYFRNLDHLITLHQRKHKKLLSVKKSMLEKMFPQNGAKVPKIRFEGFTDDWEQRKLDTITDVRDGTHDSPQYVETGHPFITSKNVKDGFINYEDIQYVSDKDYEEINKRSKVDKNDILMGMIGTIGNIALVRETPDFAIKNVALIKDIGDVYYRYLYHCLQSNSVAHQLDDNLDGGTQKFIALNKIRELVIPVPSEHEQHKIGDYMESLDNLITLHQRELDKLVNIKKSMLEKMFV